MPLPYRVLVVQIGTTLIVSSLLWWISVADALAAMTAGVVVIVPSAGFAWRVVAGGSEDATHEAHALLGSGVARLIATGVLMALAIAWCRPEPLPFFGTLIALQLGYWIVPLTAGPPRSPVRSRRVESSGDSGRGVGDG